MNPDVGRVAFVVQGVGESGAIGRVDRVPVIVRCLGKGTLLAVEGQAGELHAPFVLRCPGCIDQCTVERYGHTGTASAGGVAHAFQHGSGLPQDLAARGVEGCRIQSSFAHKDQVSARQVSTMGAPAKDFLALAGRDIDDLDMGPIEGLARQLDRHQEFVAGRQDLGEPVRAFGLQRHRDLLGLAPSVRDSPNTVGGVRRIIDVAVCAPGGAARSPGALGQGERCTSSNRDFPQAAIGVEADPLAVPREEGLFGTARAGVPFRLETSQIS